MTSIQLRPWQRAAHASFVDGGQPDFLAVATPGAGKTTFALICALSVLAEQPRTLVVVAPTSHLKVQWSRAAHRLGLQLEPDWSPGDGLARDVHGLVTTYQQVASRDAAGRLAGLAADGMVILDEIHHAGTEKAWGDGIRVAFAHAHRRLALSGTPFRSDASPIPFVRYDATGEGDLAHADFTYGYADALRDGGVVRPVYFPRVDGEMEWTTAAGDRIVASFDDELARDQMSMRLRTALSLDGDWLPAVLERAHGQLREIRADHRDAGGLVVAIDQEHAHGIARLLRDRCGVPADVVVSDDPTASRRIAEFATNDRPWLVSVRMVSEGVDIPRLRVGVYATTTTTELFFRQAVGRFVRWQSNRTSQKAYVYLPDDPRLRVHAFTIAEARRHVLRPPGDAEAEVLDDGATLDTLAHADDSGPEQLALFAVVSATATRVSIHSVDEHGVAFEPTDDLATAASSTPLDGDEQTGDGRTGDERYDDEPEVPEPAFAADPALTLRIPTIPTAAGLVSWGSLSVAERKDDLRVRNTHVAKRLVDVTGWSHARVQAEMNRLAGITKVASATTEQLERRLRYADSWLRRLTR